mgnify:CR=1 FL=1
MNFTIGSGAIRSLTGLALDKNESSLSPWLPGSYFIVTKLDIVIQIVVMPAVGACFVGMPQASQMALLTP